MRHLFPFLLCLILSACADYTPPPPVTATPAAQDPYMASALAGLTQTVAAIQSTGTQAAQDYAGTQQAAEVGVIVTRIAAEAEGTRAALDAMSKQAGATLDAVNLSMRIGDATVTAEHRALVAMWTAIPLTPTAIARDREVAKDGAWEAYQPTVWVILTGAGAVAILALGVSTAYSVIDSTRAKIIRDDDAAQAKRDAAMWEIALRAAALGLGNGIPGYPVERVTEGKDYARGNGTNKLTQVISVSPMGETKGFARAVELVMDAIELVGEDAEIIPSHRPLHWHSDQWQEGVSYLKALSLVDTVDRDRTFVTDRVPGRDLRGLRAMLNTTPTPPGGVIDGIARD